MGVDPGVSGALAMTKASPGRAPRIEGMWDAPVIKVKQGRSNKSQYVPVDAANILNEVFQHGIEMGIIELVHADGRFGAGNFKFGEGKMLWEMGFAMAGISYMLIRPMDWKKEVGLPKGADKNASILLAKKLFPKDAHLFDEGNKDGRADAALMSYVAGMYHGRQS